MKIKFVTLNIWDGGRLFDNAVAFIKKEDPDIVAMQEVYDGRNPKFENRFRTMDVFKKEFTYSAFSPVFLDTQDIGNVEQGNAIFSKFPISNPSVIFFDTPYGKFTSDNSEDFGRIPGILQQAISALNNIELNICNIHGIWGLDGEDNERRLKMSKAIIREIKNKENVILAGDFNVKPNTQTIRNIESHLKNIFKDELETTFNMKHKDNTGYATSVVDMIFVSKRFEIVDRYAPNVDVSDHIPLVCELEI